MTRLHPELQACLNGSELNHPLVKHTPALPCHFHRLNKLFEHRLQVQRGEYEPNEWDKYLPDCDSKERFEDLFCRRLEVNDYWYTTADFRRLASLVYHDPAMIAPASEFYCIALRHRPGIALDTMTQQEQATFAALPELIVVYRGQCSGLLAGCSWTLDQEIAWRWSVGQLRGDDARIACGTVKKEDVVAFYDRGGDEEILSRHVQIHRVYDSSGRAVDH